MKRAALSYTVTKADSGKTVETICRKKLNISAGLLTELKSGTRLLLNGNSCRTIDTVSENDIVYADVTDECVSDIKPADIPLDIIFEDEFFIAVNKPRKMSVHESPGNYGNTLSNAIMHHFLQNGERCRFHAVNRLDKDTSGICVIAKNRFAHNAIGDFSKKYTAVVHGIPTPEQGTITLPIKRAENSVIKRMTAPDGKPAVTHYRVTEKKENLSMLEIELETGRTHQIRVHFSAIGCPLVGDWLYGNGDNERHLAQGHLLHAYSAEFIHPATKKHIRLFADMPADMLI